jgi:adenylate kinase
MDNLTETVKWIEGLSIIGILALIATVSVVGLKWVLNKYLKSINFEKERAVKERDEYKELYLESQRELKVQMTYNIEREKQMTFILQTLVKK